jgi:hypothetical protein
MNPNKNNVPGDYNLNLLKELYGTPTMPLEFIPETSNEGYAYDETDNGQTDGTHNPWPTTDDGFNGQQQQQDQEKENGGGKEKEKVWHHRRRMVQQDRRWLEEIHQFELQATMDCLQEHCVFDYNDGYRIEVSQYFAPHMKAKLMSGLLR